MDARFYNSEDIDIERLASDLVNVYLAQGYQAQQIGNNDQTLVQLKKGGDFEAIIGMQAALSLTLQKTKGGVLAMIGQQRWVDKAAVGAVGIVALPILWPLALTAGVGALRQASLGNQVLNVVDGLVRQQKPGVQVGPVPSYLMPQLQQQWAPPGQQPGPYYTPPPQSAPPPYAPPPPTPAYVPRDSVPQAAPSSTQLRCVHCNTPYEPGDTFCSGCGRALSAPRMYCSNCNTEIKQGVAFCPRCGASTFHTLSATNQTIPRPGPAPQPSTYTSPAAPTYTPPAPQTPVYTPPKPPPKPAPPVYTPPTPQTPAAPPQPTVYYVPSSQSQTSTPAASTPASQPTQQKPPEPYYVPPTTQEPPVAPKPQVKIVPGTPKQEPPPPKPRPQKQYYIPSSQAQATQPATAAETGTPTQAPKPITARPSTEPAPDPDTVWGTLIFSDGQEVQLKGERAVVGRYDHDLGGINPDVDLNKMDGSDTVSRIHAAIEHVGSTYMLTDLNSTNATRINGKRLEPDHATPISDGDTLQFGKVTSTFKKI